MWKIASGGESYYVDHVTCELPWSTKETPNNPSTKGSIKIKRCLLTIGDDNCAEITTLTEDDAERLSGKKKVNRIITSAGHKLKEFLKNQVHSPVHFFGGGCSTAWYVTEISDRTLLLAQLVLPDIRVLMPNEDYYKEYETGGSNQEIDLDDEFDDFYDN
jgi:hypothetical protein